MNVTLAGDLPPTLGASATQTSKMKVAIVGGGWAGLAAAIALKDAGIANISVFEASHRPGGRARSIAYPGFPDELDNGQHILLGAYTGCLALMHRLHGENADKLLHRHPLHLETLGGRFRVAAPPWLNGPLAGLRLPAALILARGLSIAARWQAVRLLLALRRQQWQVHAELSVTTLLAEHGQGEAACRHLWHPLCLAAMNTPPQHASAALFAAVLRDSLGARAAASDLLLPAVDLGKLWPEAATRLVDWRPGTPARRLQQAVHNGWHINDEPEQFDAIILAVSPQSAGQLLRTLPARTDANALLQSLDAFRYAAIATLNLRLDCPWRLPFPMMQLDDGNGTLPGQWVFDRAWMTGRPQHGEISIVASVADAWLAQGRETLAKTMEQQWRTAAATAGIQTIPATTHQALIVEKRAALLATPGLQRPGAATPWPGLYLAGDWTDTGYPGVLEGAVRSGQTCAGLLLSKPAGH